MNQGEKMAINILYSIIAIIIVYFAWFHFWKRSVLEEAIDRLFFLRDNFRNYYVDSGISPDSKAYKNMRDLLNGFIKFVDEISIYTIIYIIYITRHEKEITDTMAFKDSDFNDPNISENYIFEVRSEALNIISAYLIKSTLILYIIFGFFKIIGVFRKLKNKFSESLDLHPNGRIENLVHKDAYLRLA